MRDHPAVVWAMAAAPTILLTTTVCALIWGPL